MTGHLGSTRPRRSNLAFGQATPASLPNDSSRDSRLGRPRGSSVLLSLIEVPIHRCHNYATSHAFHCSAAASNNSLGVRTSAPDEAGRRSRRVPRPSRPTSFGVIDRNHKIIIYHTARRFYFISWEC